MAMAAVYTTVNGIILSESRGGTETIYVPDTLGSLIECRDASGTKTYSAEYWPYGEVQTETGTNPSPWGFVGLLGYLKDLANLLYVRARHYRPGSARWQTMDPLWPGESAFGYVDGKPVRLVDSFGLQVVDPLKQFGCDMTQYINERVSKTCREVEKLVDTENIFSLDCKRKVRPSMDASSAFGKSKKHDMTNALGHCMTACIIQRRNPECVWYWNAREIGGVLIGDKASCMDDWNNKIGYGCAAGSASCFACCLASISKLTWYEPKPHNWPPKGGACNGSGGGGGGGGGLGPGLCGGNLIKGGTSPIYD